MYIYEQCEFQLYKSTYKCGFFFNKYILKCYKIRIWLHPWMQNHRSGEPTVTLDVDFQLCAGSVPLTPCCSRTNCICNTLKLSHYFFFLLWIPKLLIIFQICICSSSFCYVSQLQHQAELFLHPKNSTVFQSALFKFPSDFLAATNQFTVVIALLFPNLQLLESCSL